MRRRLLLTIALISALVGLVGAAMWLRGLRGTERWVLVDPSGRYLEVVNYRAGLCVFACGTGGLPGPWDLSYASGWSLTKWLHHRVDYNTVDAGAAVSVRWRTLVGICAVTPAFWWFRLRQVQARGFPVQVGTEIPSPVSQMNPFA